MKSTVLPDWPLVALLEEDKLLPWASGVDAVGASGFERVAPVDDALALDGEVSQPVHVNLKYGC